MWLCSAQSLSDLAIEGLLVLTVLSYLTSTPFPLSWPRSSLTNLRMGRDVLRLSEALPALSLSLCPRHWPEHPWLLPSVPRSCPTSVWTQAQHLTSFISLNVNCQALRGFHFLGSGGQVHHDCPFCLIPNTRGDSKAWQRWSGVDQMFGSSGSPILVGIGIPQKGLFKQIASDSVNLGWFRDYTWRTIIWKQIPKPFQGLAPSLNSSPTLSLCSTRSGHARHVPASGPWRILFPLPRRPFPSYLDHSFPNLVKIFTKVSLC